MGNVMLPRFRRIHQDGRAVFGYGLTMELVIERPVPPKRLSAVRLCLIMGLTALVLLQM
jgi:hypothetical protein